jgi:hypothetical protein
MIDKHPQDSRRLTRTATCALLLALTITPLLLQPITAPITAPLQSSTACCFAPAPTTRPLPAAVVQGSPA